MELSYFHIENEGKKNGSLYLSFSLNFFLKDQEDLKEFARFEIDKIEQVNPTIDEYEELNLIKKRLAKKEKIELAIKKASGIMEFNQNVTAALELMEVDSSFFDETMNELNNIFEYITNKSNKNELTIGNDWIYNIKYIKKVKPKKEKKEKTSL